MARITQEQLAYTLLRLKKALNLPIEVWVKDDEGKIMYSQEGSMYFDHYHGWSLYQVINRHGGITIVNRGVSERLTASEMLCFLHGMIRAAEDAKYNPALTTGVQG